MKFDLPLNYGLENEKIEIPNNIAPQLVKNIRKIEIQTQKIQNSVQI